MKVYYPTEMTIRLQLIFNFNPCDHFVLARKYSNLKSTYCQTGRNRAFAIVRFPPRTLPADSPNAGGIVVQNVLRTSEFGRTS